MDGLVRAYEDASSRPSATNYQFTLLRSRLAVPVLFLVMIMTDTYSSAYPGSDHPAYSASYPHPHLGELVPFRHK